VSLVVDGAIDLRSTFVGAIEGNAGAQGQGAVDVDEYVNVKR
jgi:hypothetical protein